MASNADLEAQKQPFLPPIQPQQATQLPTNASSIMSRFSIPIDALTSRMNLSGRFDGLRSTSVSSRFANLRPISEFLDVKRVSKPANFGEVQSRVNYNLGYFSSNYAAVFVMLSIYSLLTNLLLLFVICFIVGGMFGIGKLEGNDLQLGSWRASTSQLYTTLFIIAIPLGLWASPFTTVLWLIGASGVTVLGHAAFMDKPIESAFSEEAV
ncbi:Nn.00g099600.m01.CDS01 [Neocucurbitaria sp. VM-36]